MFYIGTLEEMLAADAQITANCGWVSNGTERWAIPKETDNVGVYAIPVPEGTHGFTKEHQIAGVTATISSNVSFQTEDSL